MKFAEYAKMYVALAGLIAAGVAGVPDIPIAWKLPLEIAIAVCGAFAVWKVENKTDDDNPPPVHWASQGPAWDEPAEKDDDSGSLARVTFISEKQEPLRLIAA